MGACVGRGDEDLGARTILTYGSQSRPKYVIAVQRGASGHSFIQGPIVRLCHVRDGVRRRKVRINPQMLRLVARSTITRRGQRREGECRPSTAFRHHSNIANLDT